MLQDALQVLQGVHDVEAEMRLVHSLGNAYTASDDFEQALQIYSRLFDLAQSVGAKASMWSALANQTRLYRQMGDFSSAVRVGRQALDLARRISSLSNEAFVRWQLALINEANGEIGAAETEMNTVIALEEQFDSLEIEKHCEHLQNLIQRTGSHSAGFPR